MTFYTNDTMQINAYVKIMSYLGISLDFLFIFLAKLFIFCLHLCAQHAQ